MSIYRLYLQNGNNAGFWIQHRSWQNVCAQVMTIAGRRSGSLPGTSPSYEHANVHLQCFDVRSGRPVPPLDSRSPQDCGFVMIAQPPWYARTLH
jgi:hypothetical protein